MALARRVKTMMRRAVERLGRDISPLEAVGLEGTEDARILLLSNKEYGKLPAAQRLGRAPPGQRVSRAGAPAVAGTGGARYAPQAPVSHVPAVSVAAPAYASVASPQMMPGPSVPVSHHRSWSDEVSEATLQTGHAAPGVPLSHSRTQASTDQRAMPATPALRGSPPRAAPPPSTGGTGSVPAPQSTTADGRRSVPAPSSSQGRVLPLPSTHG